jgi:PilZ domain
MFSTIKRPNRRSEPRDPISIPMSILCTDQDGRDTVMHARIADISARGARLCVLQKIPVRSAVTFYYQELGIGGRGTVRYCRSSSKGYDVGLEFPNGTGWKPALREKLSLLNLAREVARSERVAQERPVGETVLSEPH